MFSTAQRVAFQRSLALVPLVGVVAYALHGRAPEGMSAAASARDGVCRALAVDGVEADADDVVWVDAPKGLRGTFAGNSRAIVRAHLKGEPLHDLYLVRARRSPEGAVIDVTSWYPLTKTAGVDESRPVVHGDVIAYADVVPGNGTPSTVTGVDLIDLASEDVHVTDGWKPLWKVQNAIANLQKTGSTRGVDRRHYALTDAAERVAFRWDGDDLRAEIGTSTLVIDPSREEPLEGDKLARLEHAVKSKPGDLVTWTVDRVRGVSFLGPHFIEFLEYHAFTLKDFIKRHTSSNTVEETTAEVAQDMGDARIKPTYTDPEIGWPPAQLTPVMSPAVPNEGVWLGLDDDPFVRKNPGLPSPFVQTFLRTDPQRSYARVYITLWDPRQVALHMVAGTVEPVSATGEVGTGQVPRTPETLKSLVAGFDGGFQAIHFEGGMQVSGTLYLPPKPYAATVAEMRDGTTAFGTWPDGMPDVPDDILSMRQNLTPLVVDHIVNPYKQIKWGGTPPGSADNIHTTRSGVCLTDDGFVAYFFGNDMSYETLAKAMVSASCKLAVHLDMNAGHTGFEFYRVAPTGELPDLMRPLQGDWEAEGRVPGIDGWSFLGRRMIKGMPHMNFPRYIGRDGRDFMYLTLRAVLPGEPLIPHVQPAEPNEGAWRVKGLPQHGFPYAVATTSIRPDVHQPQVHAQILKVDPRAVKLLPEGTTAHPGAPDDTTVLVFGGLQPSSKTDAKPNDTTLWLSGGSFAIGSSSPGPSAHALISGTSATPASLATASVLLGVTDDDGTLVYVTADAPDGVALRALLQQLGCSQVMVAPPTLFVRLGGSLDLAGELAPKPLTGPTITLVRGLAPSSKLIFPDTPVVDPSVWQPLQNKRVRYFRRANAPTSQPSSAPSSASSH